MNMFLMLAAVATTCLEIDRSVMSDAYWAIWNDDVQAKIDADIEKYRKADAVISVDAPVGTKVTIEQLSHGFFFGAHIFNYNQLGKAEWNARYRALYDAEKGLFNSATVAFYWRTFERHPYAPRFAEAYEDTEEYWNREYARDPIGPMLKAHWRRPATDPVIDFCKMHGVRIHGHPLVWGNNDYQTPTWLWDDFCPANEKSALEQTTGVKIPSRVTADGKDDPKAKERQWRAAWAQVYVKLSEAEIAALVPSYVKALKSFQEKRIREIGERYGSRVDSWDVVNESASDWEQDLKRVWPFGESAAVNSLPMTKSWGGPMQANYAYEALALARTCMKKDAWLNLNECNMAAFPGQIADLRAKGADFDVVGSQMHLFDPAESAKIAKGEFSEEVRQKTSPEGIARTFGRMTVASGGKPIHLSEVTITAPDNTPRGQMVQAIVMRNCYRAWFAVEKMSGITWWNVVDDCGAAGEPSISGLFTRDMRPKAVYFAMDDLVNREWRTKCVVNVQGEDGRGMIRFRGFRGKYRLTWTGPDGTTVVKPIVVE